MQTKHLMLLLLLLSSCSPTVKLGLTQITTSTPPATQTINPPTQTPTAVLSPVDYLFVIPTQQPYFDASPIPVVTPSLKNSQMRLKDFSEEDLINLIIEMQQSSYENSPPFMGWGPEGRFITSQLPVALVIQEYLFRYPNSPHAEKLRWELAHIDAIESPHHFYGGVGGSVYDGQWVVSELEADLNAGEYSPDKLETFLSKYKFRVDYYQPIENLFGDLRIAWFYVISPLVWENERDFQKSADYFYRGGLFVVVREITPGNFRVFLLGDALDFSFGESSVFEISDHNNNGMPEIALYLGSHSGTMCGGSLKIFEWHEDFFRELTRGEIRITDCSDSFEYIINDEVPFIRIEKFFSFNPVLYKWNGSNYELSHYEYSTLLEKWLATIYDPRTTFVDEAKVIEEMLSSKESVGFEDAQVDFLRFRLGVVYALASNPLKAREILQGLVNSPMDETLKVYKDLAANFLGYYSGDKNLFFACRKSQEKLDEMRKLIVNGDAEIIFGIAVNEFTPFGVGLLQCYDEEALQVLFSNKANVITNLPEELFQHGIIPSYKKRLDLNLDGLDEEWLIVIDGDAYLVFPVGFQHETNKLKFFGLGEAQPESSALEVKIEKSRGFEKPWIIFRSGNEISIYTYDGEASLNNMAREYEVNTVSFSGDPSPAQYQVFYRKPQKDDYYPELPWEGYRWDSTNNRFKDDLLEYNLFVLRDAKWASEKAGEVFPLLEDWTNSSVTSWQFPQYYYLCGLSYELAGDSQKAVEIYLQLWRDFPDSSYALLVKSKLEPAAP